KDGTFSNAFKHNNRWHILKEEIDAFKEQEKIKLKKTKDCMDVNSTAKLLDIPIHRVKYLIKNGTFSDAFKHNERWYISRDHVDAFKEQEKIKLKKTKNCMDVNNTAKHLNLPSKEIRDLIKNGTFSNVVKYKGKMWISLREIKEFEVNETKLSIEKVTEILNLNSTNKIFYLIKQ